MTKHYTRFLHFIIGFPLRNMFISNGSLIKTLIEESTFMCVIVFHTRHALPPFSFFRYVWHKCMTATVRDGGGRALFREIHQRVQMCMLRPTSRNSSVKPGIHMTWMYDHSTTHASSIFVLPLCHTCDINVWPDTTRASSIFVLPVQIWRVCHVADAPKCLSLNIYKWRRFNKCVY